MPGLAPRPDLALSGGTRSRRGLHPAFDLVKLTTAGHYGLVGISERVTLMGGHVKIQNRAEGGTILRVEIPHPRVEAPIDSRE